MRTVAAELPEARVALPKQAFVAILLRATFVMLEFLSGVVLARAFLAAGYGVYAFVVSCVGVLAIPATAGLDRFLVREVAACRTRGEWSLLRGLVRRSFQVTVGVSLAITLLAGLLLHALRAGLPAPTLQAMAVGLAIVPLMAIARLRSAALQGMGRVLTGSIPESIILPGTVLALSLFVYLSPAIARSAGLAVGINLLATVAALGCGAWLLRRARPAQYSQAVPQYRTRQWVSASLPMAWVLGMNVLMTSTDVILLGMLDSTDSAGIYRVAAQMAALVALPLGAVNAVLAPRIASAYSAGDRDALQHLATHSSRIVLSLALPAALVLVFLGGVLLALYGAGFEAARPALNVLVFGQLVNAATGSVGYLLIMTRYERLAAMLFGLSALLNVLLNLLLIPRLGAMGAAVASCATLVSLNLGLALTVRRKLGIRATAFGGGRR